jgi:putative ABC transport system permease protein
MLRRWLRGLFRRNRFEREMRDELQAHIARYIDDLTAAGLPAEEAERRARMEFGTVEAIREDCRQAVGLRWTDEFLRNLRFGVRLLGKNPGFVVTAVLTLGLCIGVNTAIFSVVDAALFRPLPFPEPDRLVMVARLFEHQGTSDANVSQDGSVWEDVRDHATDLEAAAYAGMSGGANLVAGRGVEFVQQQRVSAGLFHVLGVAPFVGREFTRAEDRQGGRAVTILSYGLWRRVFHADPGVVGKTVLLAGAPYTVVGVMPEVNLEDSAVDLWTPLRASTTGEGGGQNYGVIARLRPGVTWAQAEAQLLVVGRPAMERYKLSQGVTVRLDLVPLRGEASEEIATSLLVLWGAVGVVLLIGCVNIANLLLARGSARAREIATRMALGSGKAAVLRQMLAEGFLLALLGGGVGVGLGYVGMAVLRAAMREDLGLVIATRLDGRVLLATAAVALATSLLFGLFPAWQASRLDIRSGLVSSGRGVAGPAHRWPRRALVVTEVALGFVLLIGAGLLIRTFAYLRAVPAGFDGRNVITGSMSLNDARYTTSAQVNRLFDESLRRVRELPGVEAAAVSLNAPYERPLNDWVEMEGPTGWTGNTVNVTYVTPEFLKVLKIPLLRGRWIRESDDAHAAKVAVVNESVVQHDFGGRDPVGRHLREGGTEMEIVGVVGTVAEVGSFGDFGPMAGMPMVYVPAQQVSGKFFTLVHTWFSPSWLVRYRGRQSDMVEGMRRAMASVDPKLPFSSFRTLPEVRAQSLAMERFQSVLLGSIAGLALLLSAVGIYGLIANSVVERTRELGIRIALGATLGQTVRSVALPGLVLAAVGVVVGYPAARGAAHLLRHLVWGVKPADAATFAAVAAVLLAVAALASAIPALRVARVDPVARLREE